MEVGQLAPADMNPMGAFICVLLPDLRGEVGGPLDRDPGTSRPATGQDSMHIEVMSGEESRQSLEPGCHRCTRMALAAEWVVAREDVVNVVSHSFNQWSPVARPQLVEGPVDLAAHECVIHAGTLVRDRSGSRASFDVDLAPAIAARSALSCRSADI